MNTQPITVSEAVSQGFSPYSVGGRSRIFQYTSAGIPIPGNVTECYRKGEELLAFSLPMTAAEHGELLDYPVRHPNGSPRDITYREYLERSA